MSASEKRTELIVGLFLFIGLALLAGLILQFGQFRKNFGGQYFFTVVFDDASGLIKGSEVRMGGARIGEVARLPELNEAVQAEVEVSVRRGIRIPDGSTFQINSATLLGDKLIVVTPPAEKSGRFIDPGSRHIGEGPSGLDALQSSAESVGKDVQRILKQAEATLAKVDGAVDDIRTASKSLGEAVGKINRSILAEDNLAHIQKTLAHLETTSGKLDPALAEAREAVAAVRSAAARTERTLENADKTLAAVKPALEGLPAAVKNVSRTAEKAGATFDRMNRGEGMLGAFASDNDVALDFKAFMKNLRRHGVLLYQNDAGKPEETSPSRIKGRPH